MPSQVRVNWQGKKVLAKITPGLVNGLVEFSGAVEQASKRQLYPGHGFLTGSLQRSLHADNHDYQFRNDNMPATASTPERGRKTFIPKIVRDIIRAAIGAGQRYALEVHQGAGNFAGYHYITNGLQNMIGEVPRIFKRNVKGD